MRFVDRDHRRVELVVAVGARPGDVQRQRELRERVDDRVDLTHRRAGPNRRARASRRAPADRPACARTARRRSDPRACCAASCAGSRSRRTRSNMAIDVAHLHRRARRGAPCARARSRRWASGRRRSARPCPPPWPGVVRDLDRHGTVRVVTHAGGQPFADLALHHHQHALIIGAGLERGDDDRRRRRCTAGWRP